MKVTFSFVVHSLFLLIFISACSPNKKAGEEVIGSYEEYPGVITLKIPPGLIGVFISKDDQDLKEAFKEMESIKIIMVDMAKTDSIDIRSFGSGFEDKLELVGFEELLSVNDGQDRIKILILEQEEKIVEMMGLLSSEEEFLGINLSGEINQDQLANIIKEIEISDFNIGN
ncbi:MAG: DUF4252 domain-containing protein [Bacteroidales bacterium]|nr:DUF4252 domain-containing protein [Bacteroidales bacterium]